MRAHPHKCMKFTLNQIAHAQSHQSTTLKVREFVRTTAALQPERRYFSGKVTPGFPLVSLERSVGARQGVDKSLWENGSFDCEVYPDLPIDTSWGEVFRRAAFRQKIDDTTTKTAVSHPERLSIHTVGCQTRSRAALQERLTKAVKSNANGVLLLSGSHPAHRLSVYLGRTPDSIELLKLATSMKQEKKLPSSLALWAVENPLRNPASRLATKLDAGAEVILTQPPLLWDTFAAWWKQVHRMGLTDQGSILEFNAKAADNEEFVEFLQEYNSSLIQKVMQLPGVGGVHVMPLTKAARQQVLTLQTEGILPMARVTN